MYEDIFTLHVFYDITTTKKVNSYVYFFTLRNTDIFAVLLKSDLITSFLLSVLCWINQYSSLKYFNCILKYLTIIIKANFRAIYC